MTRSNAQSQERAILSASPVSNEALRVTDPRSAKHRRPHLKLAVSGVSREYFEDGPARSKNFNC